MASWHISIAGLPQVPIELAEAAHAGIVAGLDMIGARGSSLVQDNIDTPYNGKPAAVAFGQLVNSVHGDIVEGGSVNTVVIAAHPPADVYAAPVETGTRPHFPPPSALVPWVKLKLGAASDKEALSIAFAVAKTIAQRGTQGHFMFERALDQLAGEAGSIMDRALAEALMAAGYKAS